MNLAGSQVDAVGGSSGIGRATAKVALAPGGSATIAQEKLRQAQAEFEPSRAMLADVTCEGEDGARPTWGPGWVAAFRARVSDS
jgi:NAD(P)-dependent dehydrogenase (short-subunit alcohol dehydrogenase family)